MKKLWAPWRIKYVAKTQSKGCVLCRAYKRKNDTKNYIVLRSKYCFVLLNTFPYNNGHIMVVPNRHIASLEFLSTQEMLDMNKTLVTMIRVLRKVLRPHGFNVGINLGRVSGAGIDKHLHMHLVPRWSGDTNFMPVVAHTKVISQSLHSLQGEIKKYVSRYVEKS
ncbi:MAG: HIT domain-containing protein [Candidatus Omnitrophota bacterium]